jgi:hypothetical protein
MNVIFFNHKIINCGVYQYGKRVIEILLKDLEINYIYKEIDCYTEYHKVISENVNISAIIYNYHSCTMEWLNYSNIQRTVKNIGIPHESPVKLFDIVCNIDPDAPESFNKFSLIRPIYENIEEIISTPFENDIINNFINEYTDTNMPIFGSFGFGFDNKGFDKIVKLVNEQYNNAVIKLVIPIAHFDLDQNRNHRINKMVNLCKNINNKPGIKLMITHEFFSTSDILKFLNSNTMNIFLYDTMPGRSISSTIDYAISVKKPLAISDSFMFRHIYSDEICLYKNTIEHCLQNSVNNCSIYLEKYSHRLFIEKFKNILLKI